MRRLWMIPAVLALVAATAAAVMVTKAPTRLERRVFFFPTAFPETVTIPTPFADGRYADIIVPESRLVPRRHDLEAQIELLVDEIILGPVALDLLRVVPRTTTVLSVLERSGTVFVNFSQHIAASDPDVTISAFEALQLITDTVAFNFPSVVETRFFVEGQVPFEPPMVFDNTVMVE